MEKFLNWRIVLRKESPYTEGLPAALRCLAPPFRHSGLPEEVGLLLPNRDGLSAQLDALDSGTPKDGLADSALGLFLADPFIHLARVVPRLARGGVSWVANLPSVEQQDSEFSQQLSDVGLDGGLEVKRLEELKGAGFRVLAVVADADSARAAAAIGPEALIVLPRVGDFAAGFPSFRQRGAAAAAVRETGWRGPLLGLAEIGESAHETLWPEALDGVVCRPAVEDA